MANNILYFLITAVFSCYPMAEAKAGVPVKKQKIEKTATVGECIFSVTVDRPVCSNTALKSSLEKSILEAMLNNHSFEIPKDAQSRLKGKTFDKAVQAYADMIAQAMAEEYGDDMPSDPDEAMKWYGSMEVNQVADAAGYVSYEFSEERFSGGAHGMYHFVTLTFRKSDGKPLKNILRRDNESSIEPLLSKSIKNQEAVKPYLEYMESNTLPLPMEDGWLAPDGLHIMYQPYEIGNWAMGAPEFVIPVSKAIPLISSEAARLLRQK